MIVHKSSLASGRRERIGDSRNKRGAVEEVSASPESIPAVCLRSSSFIYFPAASSSRWLFISFLYRTRRRPGRNRIRAHPSFLSLAQFQRPPKSNSAAALLITAVGRGGQNQENWTSEASANQIDGQENEKQKKLVPGLAAPVNQLSQSLPQVITSGSWRLRIERTIS